MNVNVALTGEFDLLSKLHEAGDAARAELVGNGKIKPQSPEAEVQGRQKV